MIKTILKVYRRVINLLFILYLSVFKKNISLGSNIFFLGLPILQLEKNSRILIGQNTTLNSSNRAYHLNMWGKCRLIVKSQATLKIGNNTRIHGSCIHCYKSISIGDNVLIAANCQIFENNGHDLSFENIKNRINTKGKTKPIIIENNVWLGTGVVVLPGVVIGEGSVISANSLVSVDIPAFSLAGGNPIKIIKDYSIHNNIN